MIEITSIGNEKLLFFPSNNLNNVTFRLHNVITSHLTSSNRIASYRIAPNHLPHPSLPIIGRDVHICEIDGALPIRLFSTVARACKVLNQPKLRPT